jgi:hypothetical protein
MMIGLNWGATPSERAARLPCDALVSDASTKADRAISINASPTLVYSWLCQLRVAPYSYDILDNFGRRSPRQRTPELGQLEIGHRFMTIFTLQSFVECEQITLKTKRVVVTYALGPSENGARLHVRVWFEIPRFVGRVAAMGDLVMMRKQLLTLKSLAEREAASQRDCPPKVGKAT